MQTLPYFLNKTLEKLDVGRSREPIARMDFIAIAIPVSHGRSLYTSSYSNNGSHISHKL